MGPHPGRPNVLRLESLGMGMPGNSAVAVESFNATKGASGALREITQWAHLPDLEGRCSRVIERIQ